jgi:antitoxin (DNA-binding transcriptional repressor) of toxin-antitoxin stability system
MISAKKRFSTRSGRFGRAKAGRPVARLVPLDRKPRPKRFGGLKGRIRVPDDFNAPLDPHVIAAFEGRS